MPLPAISPIKVIISPLAPTSRPRKGWSRIKTRDRLNKIYVKHTGQSLKKIEDALERDYFLTADAARDFGIVDKVYEKRIAPAD